MNPTRDGTDLVLSRADAGRIGVKWHVEPYDLQQTRSVFPAGIEPVPVIQLIRLIGPGQSEPVVRVPLSEAELLSDGRLSLTVSDDGVAVQAELGLETSDGGWLMLARSSSVIPSGDAVLAPVEAVVPKLDSARLEPALAATGMDLVPVFPEIEVGDGLQEMASDAISGPAIDPAPAADASREGGLSGPAPTRPDIDSAPVLVPDDRSPQPERQRGSSYGNIEPRYGVGEDGGLEVYAELLVHGRATPGAEIDLFGHRIKIGSGGRFALHLPVPNSKLLQQALDQGLPLAARERSDT